MNSQKIPITEQNKLLTDLRKGLSKLPGPLINKILSFNDRRDFENFANASSFFKSIAQDNIYKKLAAPEIDFDAFANKYPDEDKRIKFHIAGGGSVSAIMQLNNGNLVTGTYGENRTRLAQICLWGIEREELLAKFTRPHGQITAFAEISPNILIASYYDGHIEFFDFNNKKKPTSLGKIILPGEKGHVQDFSLYAPGRLALVSYISGNLFESGKDHLNILHFDPNSIHTKTMKLERIDILSRPLTHSGEHKIFSLPNQHLLVVMQDCMCVYNLNDENKNKQKPVKTIRFSKEKYYPFAIQLADQKIITAFAIQEPKKLVLDIWDFTKEESKEFCKTISLPTRAEARGIELVFQKINGEIIIIPDDFCGTRILILDINRQEGKEVLQELDTHLSSLYHSKFIEDGRYLLTRTGNRIECIRFPLLKEAKAIPLEVTAIKRL